MFYPCRLGLFSIAITISICITTTTLLLLHDHHPNKFKSWRDQIVVPTSSPTTTQRNVNEPSSHPTYSTSPSIQPTSIVWFQRGQDIQGLVKLERMGYSTALSYNGQRLVMAGKDGKSVRVYEDTMLLNHSFLFMNNDTNDSNHDNNDSTNNDDDNDSTDDENDNVWRLHQDLTSHIFPHPSPTSSFSLSSSSSSSSPLSSIQEEYPIHVAISPQGEFILVGLPHTHENTGTVFMFQCKCTVSASNEWISMGMLHGTNKDDSFGFDADLNIIMDGNHSTFTIAIGAPMANYVSIYQSSNIVLASTNTETAEFHWNHIQTLHGSDYNDDNDVLIRFGHSLSLTSLVLAIGAPLASNGKGSVHLFYHASSPSNNTTTKTTTKTTTTTFTQQQHVKWILFQTLSTSRGLSFQTDKFGYFVSLSSVSCIYKDIIIPRNTPPKVLAVGAPGSGYVRLFHVIPIPISTSTPASTPTPTPTKAQNSSSHDHNNNDDDDDIFPFEYGRYPKDIIGMKGIGFGHSVSLSNYHSPDNCKYNYNYNNKDQSRRSSSSSIRLGVGAPFYGEQSWASGKSWIYLVNVFNDNNNKNGGDDDNDDSGDDFSSIQSQRKHWTWREMIGIDGSAGWDVSGQSVSLSGDGNRAALGATGNLDAGYESGHVRVFESDGVVS